jgi:hypothetical protein
VINQMLYLCGAPGVGKSTLARELTHRWDKELLRTHPVPHSRLLHPASRRQVGLELGVPRDSFPGTDALAMDIGPRALMFLSTVMAPFALGEGSRLATRPFIGGLARAGVQVTLVRLAADEELLTRRWEERGSRQSPRWRKGAATRERRLSDWFSDQIGAQPGFHRYLDIDATEQSVSATADLVRGAFPLIDLREAAA